MLLAGIILITGSGPASAHATLANSSPADGSTLDRAPSSLTLTFDEDVLVHSASFTLRSADGTVLARTGPGAAQLHVTGPTAGTAVTVALPPLGNGAFNVTWTVQSADDLHPTSGTLVFGVGQPVTAGRAERWGPAPATRSTVVRWLELLAFAVLLGAVLVVTAVAPRGRLDGAARTRLDAALWRTAGFAASAAAVIGLAVLVDAVAGPRHVLPTLVDTLFGRLWVLREVALVAIAGLAAGAAGGHRTRLRAGVGALAGLGAVASLAGASHVAAGGGRPIALVLLTVHLAAAAAWAGAVLVFGVLASMRLRGHGSTLTPGVLRAFAWPAAGCVAVLATTGIALTARQVASLDALLTTAYGQLLVAKLALAGVAGLLGLTAMLRLRRGSPAPASSLRRGIWLEAAALVAVLAAAAAMSVGTPARGPAFAPTVRVDQPRLAAQVSDLFETLDLAPNRVGQSWLRVTVDQTRRPEPAPVVGVSAVLAGPDGRALPRRSLVRSELAHRWELPSVTLTAAGRWHVAVAVHRAGRPDVVWSTSWTVASGPLDARTPLLSDRPWARTLDRVALGLAAMLSLLGLLGIGRLRRRPPPPAGSPGTRPEDQKALVTVT